MNVLSQMQNLKTLVKVVSYHNEINNKKIIITGDSLLNCTHKKGLSKNHSLKIKNIAARTNNSTAIKLMV